MDLRGVRVGFALTGSFCTFSAVLPEIKRLKDFGADVFPIMSETAASVDTRFGKAEDIRTEIENITDSKIWRTVYDVEPIGPKKLLDIIVVAPCTGNTLGKIANGITDTSVSMAVKAHLRNSRPVVIAVSTNDGLGTSCKNIGTLLNAKNIFFVPFRQDDAYSKPNSVVSDMTQIIPALSAAMLREQLQPVIL